MSYNQQNRGNRGQGGWRAPRGGYPRGGARGRGGYVQPYEEREYPAAAGGVPAVDPPPPAEEGKKKKQQNKPKKEVKENDTPVLKPKALSTTSSAEKNDPLINEAILIDGISGFVERTRTRQFYDDFSQYLELVKTSYNAQITFDRGMKKFVSFGMYQYYAIVLLWRRILYVISQRGEYMTEYDKLVRFLNFDVPEPADLSLYLNGIGDITDFSDRKFQYALQTYPIEAEIMGARGTYGRVAPGTAIMYETLPSLFVALEKMRQDLLYTIHPDWEREWDLPDDLRPLDPHAVMPTANLLGWSLADKLSVEQQGALGDAMFGEFDYNVVNIGNLPINQLIIKYVAGMLENSKCKALGSMSSTPTGSVSQIPFAVRALDDTMIQPLRPISAKGALTNCYSQASSHIASGAACFRYRLQRRGRPEVMDSSCYRFDFENPPMAWLENEDNIYMAGTVYLWNTDQYCLSEQDGSGLATMVSTRVRRKVTKD